VTVTADAPPATAEIHCAQCGTALAEDQEWCLECGTARTFIHDAPGWRIPVAIVGAVVALVALGAVLALLTASKDVNRTAAFQPAKAPAATTSSALTAPAVTPGTSTPATTPGAAAPAVAPSAAATPTATAPHVSAARPAATAVPAHATRGSPNGLTVRHDKSGLRIAGWPARLGGWTVILTVSATRAGADGWASSIGAKGIPVGVLHTNQHRGMTPGYWVVFSGRYASRAGAQAAAGKLLARGQSLAHAHIVAPPGG
jgi:septal ring-binding cell division protein DamX